MTEPRTTRLAVIVSHPTQYYSPWFRRLSASDGVALRVFYLWDFGITQTQDPRFKVAFKWDVDLLSGYDSEVVPNTAKRPGAEHFFGFRNPGLTMHLSRWEPDCILLFGYNWFSHLRVVLWGLTRGVPIVFRGDSHLIGRPRPRLLSRLALGFLFNRFAAITYVGLANRDYFSAMGVPARKLFFAPHSVDASRFSDPEGAGAAAARALRAQLAIAEHAAVTLYAGKFVPEKQPLELIDAFIAAAVPHACLVFVGDGELKGEMERRARAAIPGTIHFLPFANQSEMPSRYLLADVFALPSRGQYETWGLAVNEAMHLGVPCLVSDRVGCQRDLVTDEETGWVFSAEDPAGLRRAITRALADVADPLRRTAIREAVFRRISSYRYDDTTKGVLAAVAYARGARP